MGTAGEYGVGNASTPIHLSNLQCTGNESELYQCNGNEQPTGCTHNNDVSLECIRKYFQFTSALYFKVGTYEAQILTVTM